MVTVYTDYSELTKFQSKAKILDILICLGDLIVGNGVLILLLLGVKIRTPGPQQGSPPCSGWLGKEALAVWQLSEAQQVCRAQPGQPQPL